MRKNTQAILYRRFTLTIAFIFGCVFTIYSQQCPQVTNNNQSFCDIDAPRIADLVAANNGNSVRWYATATSTSPLSNSLGLINGEDYFADNNSGNCPNRESVVVTIYGPPAGLSFQGVCVDQPDDATIANLFAIGNDIQWYSQPNGGSPLPLSTILMDNNIYYVDQSNPDTGCRTSKKSVFVNVGVVPVPIGSPIQEYCSDMQPPPTVADLNASGINNWYLTISSASPLDPSTPLIEGQSYFATTVDPPCESDERLEVLVVFNTPKSAGTSGTIAFCETDLTTIGTVNLFDTLSDNPDNGGTWIGPFPTSNGNLGTVNVTTMSNNGSPYVFTYSVATNQCETRTSTVTITIAAPLNPGTDGSLIFCESDAPQDLFNGLGGTPESSGNWSPLLASGSGIFDPALDTAGDYTYTLSGTPPCGDATAIVTVTVNPLPDPGTNGSLDICENDSPQDLFDSLGGTPDTGGNWTPALSSGTGVFDPTLDAPGDYTYVVTGASPCPDASAIITVNIIPLPVAGTDGSLILCENDAPQDMFNSLEGTPDSGGTWSPSLTSGTGVFDPAQDDAGVYTYTVTGISPCADASASVTVTVNPLPNPGSNGSLSLCENDSPKDLFNSLGGTPDAGGTWTPALSSGTGIFDPTLDAPGTYTYMVSGTPPCGDASTTVSVTIIPLPIAGTNGGLLLCENDTPQNLFNSLEGTPDTGGVWSPALTSGTGVFDPAQDVAGVYTYTVTGIFPCADASADVTVTVNPLPNPGNNDSLSLCENDSPQDLFNSLGGTPDAGGTWTPALSSGTGVFDPALDTPGTYTYTVSGTPPCGDTTATVSVTIIPLPIAGTNGGLLLCENDVPQDLFNSLEGTPDAGGIWSPALTSGSGVFDPALDVAGVYTYTVTGISPCADASASVSVTINPLPNPGNNDSLSLCENDSPQDLYNSLGGTPDAGGIWTPTLASGTGVFNPALDAPGTYTYTIMGTLPCGDTSATVTVTINPLPIAGTDGSLILCENDAPQDLFNSLVGTADAGGIWTPSLTSGTGIFDPSVDLADVYTYTVTGISPCADASASVTVTINPLPNPGTNGSLNLCELDAPQDLFDSLVGTPETGGAWTPALSSGTGVFDLTKDAPGTYTYTLIGTPPCGNTTATVTVTINPLSDAGDDGRLVLCSNDAPINLFDSLGGTPDAGGTWTPTLSSGTGVFDPKVDSEGDYTYTLSGPNFCGVDTSTVNVSIVAQPNVNGLLLTVDSICLDESSEATITGSQLEDGPFSLSYSLSGANTSQNTIDITILDGDASFTILNTLLTIPGATTITITSLTSTTTTCSGDVTSIPTIQFTVIQDPAPQLITNGNSFCLEDDPPTISSLSANLIGSNPVNWYDALENGTVYSNDTLLIDGQTYYASNIIVDGCDNGDRLAVTVAIIRCEELVLVIPDGFSPNDDNINDDFLIKNLSELYPNFKLQIYNRYGNILYTGDSNTPNWNGKSDKIGFGNSGVPTGVYFYILELNDITNKTIQGRVYLNR